MGGRELDEEEGGDATGLVEPAQGEVAGQAADDRPPLALALNREQQLAGRFFA